MTHPRLAAQLYTVRELCKTDDFLVEMAKIEDIGYTAVQVSGSVRPSPTRRSVRSPMPMA